MLSFFIPQYKLQNLSFFPSYPGDLFYLVSHSSLTMKYRMCQICCVVPFILNAMKLNNSGDFKSEIFNLG